MRTVWPWIFGIAVGLILITMVFAVRSDRQDYWVARGTVLRPTQPAQVEEITLIRFPCREREGSIGTAKVCGFYVWKK